MALPWLVLITQMAMAAEIDGRALSAWWALPFAGMLLTIAIMPLAIPHIWHHQFGKIAAGWALLLLAVAGLVPMSGTWKPGIGFDVFGTEVELQQIVRDVLLIAVTFVSLAVTRRSVRDDNQFCWAAMQEVAKLFIGIFVTMVPVLAMLKAGEAGPFAAVVRSVTGPGGEPLPWAYFWFTGALSSFLDNAPTYLVFFNLAGGDPQVLMTTGAATLAAISAGAVFMGSNTYIGNAPNFMVKAIAEERGSSCPASSATWPGAAAF